MATAAKPRTAGKPLETEQNTPPPAKGGKMKLIVIILVLLLAGGGAAAYFLMKPGQDHGKKEKVADNIPPKYVALGTFTANLMRDDDTDRYLQVAISIKVSKPGLEEAIKARDPEILSRVNMLLSSQHPSVLYTIAGKVKLAHDIKSQIETILGIHTVSAPIVAAASGSTAMAPAVADNSGIDEVLFTSFIIQ